MLRELGRSGRLDADTYIKNDILSIEESIVNHVEYTMARSRYKFDDQEAYMATAYSLRDRLIESWNDTQAYFKCALTLWSRPAGCWRPRQPGLARLPGASWQPAVAAACRHRRLQHAQ